MTVDPDRPVTTSRSRRVWRDIRPGFVAIATVLIGFAAGALQYSTFQWFVVFHFVERFLDIRLRFIPLKTFVFPLTILSPLYAVLIAAAPRIRLFLCSSWAGAVLMAAAFTRIWIEIATGSHRDARTRQPG